MYDLRSVTLTCLLALCVSVPSLDDVTAAVCPTDKPHKCLPYGDCYGKYYYCSSASKNAKTCISKQILLNPDSRKQLCQDIANGKNITESIRNPACDLKTDCFKEYETLFRPTSKEVSVPSSDVLAHVVCPTDKPLKCFPHGFCYGKYHYCSPASKTAEPCINETILLNPDSRKQLCQDIANGKNITESIRNPACDLKTDCFKEFETLFRPTSKEGSAFPWWCIMLICIAVIASILAATSAFLYFREKAKRCKYSLHPSNTNDGPTFNIPTNNRMNRRLLENGNQSQQSADPELNDTGNNTELVSLVRRGGDDADNAHNPPDSCRAPDPAAIDIHIDAPSGSVNNNSHHLSASFGSEPPEEDQSSTFPKRTHGEDHPAEAENRTQRAVHMASSELSGTAQLVTDHTEYNRTNSGDLD